MDLGTANTLIIHNGKVVVDEPSIVAIDVRTQKVVAVGMQAKMMHERTNPNIRTIRPLKDGVIADFTAAEMLIRGLVNKVKTNGHLFSPSLKMVIGIPSGSTNVEIRAVRDSADRAGGREVYMIFEPMAAALGAGLDVYEEEPAKENKLFELDNIVCTPHIAASTKEAQRDAAIIVANEVITLFKGDMPKNVINMPRMNNSEFEETNNYLELCEKLGSFISQSVSSPITKLEITGISRKYHRCISYQFIKKNLKTVILTSK